MQSDQRLAQLEAENAMLRTQSLQGAEDSEELQRTKQALRSLEDQHVRAVEDARNMEVSHRCCLLIASSNSTPPPGWQRMQRDAETQNRVAELESLLRAAKVNIPGRPSHRWQQYRLPLSQHTITHHTTPHRTPSHTITYPMSSSLPLPTPWPTPPNAEERYTFPFVRWTRLASDLLIWFVSVVVVVV